MWGELLKLAAANGLWAVLFCVLLIYQLRESKAREMRYQATIQSLNENLGIVKEIKNDVEEIRESIKLSLPKSKQKNIQKTDDSAQKNDQTKI